MVIISTSAVEVSIQAVLPVSSTGVGAAGAAAAAAGAASCAKAATLPNAARASEPSAAARPVVFKVEGIFIELSIGIRVRRSERVGVCFAGTDAHRLIDAEDEDFAVADLAGLGGRRDGFDGFVDQVGADRDFDLD